MGISHNIINQMYIIEKQLGQLDFSKKQFHHWGQVAGLSTGHNYVRGVGICTIINP
jgi:hypothetical protein